MAEETTHFMAAREGRERQEVAKVHTPFKNMPPIT
jgi:hypothetical protein